MWPWDDQMQTFKALSYRDKLRVSRCLVRGRAPDDPRMAVAAVELAESYKRQGRASTAWMRWSPWIVIVCFGYMSVPNALKGDLLMAIIYSLIVLFATEELLFGPATRPNSMARSLEASRRVIASGK
jgi:hypothetical protein